jgi:hypothetical protein
MLNAPDNTFLLIKVKKACFWISYYRNLINYVFPGSVSTSRRAAVVCGIVNFETRQIRLTPRHKEARVGFALEHLAKDNAFWSSVVFSNGKDFQSSRNGRVRVYRPRNSRYDERYVEPTKRSGRFSINVWGWISAVTLGVMLHVEERLY